MRRLIACLFIALLPGLATAEDTVLTVYNWNDYIDPQVLLDFEKETGIKIDYKTYASAAEMNEMLASGAPVDIVVPTNPDLADLIQRDQLLPLDFSQLPNRQNIDQSWMMKLLAFDAGNTHAVPYLWGAVGIAVNKPKAEAAFGGPLPNSWSLVFDPAQVTKLSSCGVSILDSVDDVMTSLMNYRGRIIADSTPGQILRSGEVLQQVKPHLRYVDSERYIDDLANGNLCVAVSFVGDALAAADAGQPVEFLIPDEGATLFIDSLAIPRSSQHPAQAHRFIDYLMRPDVIAKITKATLYPNANAASTDLLPESLRSRIGIVPDKATKRRLALLTALPEPQQKARDQVWSELLQ
ncbi:extracellular solute-binding protein [Pseudomonas sp. N040]|uniref:extracellular solute-binding protein n=1 Tax=Pseudomonas sp. N040 TaxID=2785325 RepID=UPI0018A29714|nr:extracellular solute-binding protein [Pseudomonas sp. N040]MBF7730039.1 extracellular solute-binding protein [Pseudomonas sp. N040]MBW7013681.1 extracellular solute-binding protein [Pseudomonas sp. N040]